MKNTILIITTILVSFSATAQKIGNIKKCISTPKIVPFIQNDLFGYYDIKAKKVVIQPKYAKAYPYQEDHYRAPAWSSFPSGVYSWKGMRPRW